MMEDVFRSTFDNADGRTMLWWILNECGYFATDPRYISPELMAFANRLLMAGGVNTPAKAGRYIDSLMVSASAPEGRSIVDEDEQLEV